MIRYDNLIIDAREKLNQLDTAFDKSDHLGDGYTSDDMKLHRELQAASNYGEMRLVLGYTVVASFATPRGIATAPGEIILCQRDDGTYVTWWRNRETGGCVYGHYLDTLEEARADFVARVMGSPGTTDK